MALGETLRRAREQMGLTASEVAAGTNMKVQLVQELEAVAATLGIDGDAPVDFSRFT